MEFSNVADIVYKEVSLTHILKFRRLNYKKYGISFKFRLQLVKKEIDFKNNL